MKVLDLSNHDLSTFDPACLEAEGVERAIVGCWDLEATKTIVQGCRAPGIVVEDLYCFLYYGLPWEMREVENAISVARSQGAITRVWLDCEAQFTEWPGDLDTEAPGMTPAGRIAATKRARAALEREGVEVGVYTGEYWWPSNMANTTEFTGLKLWLANYGANDPANPRPPITRVAFGGWTKVAVHQYSSRIEVCGRRRDHNYWMIEEDDMGLIEELRERVGVLEAIVAANGVEEWVSDANRADLEWAGVPAAELSQAKVKLTGERALKYASRRGWSAFLGLLQVKERLAAVEQRPAAVLPETIELEGGTLKVKVGK